jgi:sigma-B regulation protein RsbU (phosphoserine phosphatase)
MFVTVFDGVLDLTTGRLRYCNAGHEAPLLLCSDVCVVPCDPNLPVGVMPGWGFTAQEVTLAHGTTVFLYTDGLNEAEDASHVQFGDERILREAEALVAEQGTAANDSSPAATGFSVAADSASAAKPVVKPQAVIERMKKAVHHFVGTAEQSDDLTMLAIGYF